MRFSLCIMLLLALLQGPAYICGTAPSRRAWFCCCTAATSTANSCMLGEGWGGVGSIVCVRLTDLWVHCFLLLPSLLPFIASFFF